MRAAARRLVATTGTRGVVAAIGAAVVFALLALGALGFGGGSDPCSQYGAYGQYGEYGAYGQYGPYGEYGAGYGQYCFGGGFVPGTTRIVSIGSTGVRGDGDSSDAAVSGDGRFAAFASSATNLVAGDRNETSDVFVHDLTTGATELVDRSSTGAAADGAARQPSLSGDGRFVAFTSAAANLVSGDTNAAEDVFVRDRLLGTTERVSVGSDGAQAFVPGSPAPSDSPSISADGRFVAFVAPVAAFGPGLDSGLVHHWTFDEASGSTVVDSVGGANGTLSSSADRTVGSNGTGGAVETETVHDSYVEFPSSVLALGTSDFTVALWIREQPVDVGLTDVFGNRTEGTCGNYLSLRTNTSTGAFSGELSQDGGCTNYAIVGLPARPIDGQWHQLALTRSGSTLSFYRDGVLEGSTSTGGVVDLLDQGKGIRLGRRLEDCCDYISPAAAYDDLRIYDRALAPSDLAALAGVPSPFTPAPAVYLRDRQTGTTTLVAENATDPVVSADGGSVAYASQALDDRQVYRWSRATHTTQAASVTTDGTPATSLAVAPSISGGGNRVVFASNAPNLNPAHDDLWHVYVHDFEQGTTTLVDTAADGAPADGEARVGAISPDGGFVAFTTPASNVLARKDENAADDVYIHDLARGTTQLADVASTGTQANGQSDGAALSTIGSAGGVVVFRSDATNLVPGDRNDKGDVFARRLPVTAAVAEAGGPPPGNGRVYFLHANDFGSQADLWWADPRGGTNTPVPGASSPVVDEALAAPSPEGGRLVWEATVGTHGGTVAELVLGDRDGNDQVQLTDNAVFDGEPAWSPDGRTIAFASERDGMRGIYLLDVATRTVRKLYQGTYQADSPTFSPDGTRIAFSMWDASGRRIYTIPVAGGTPTQLTAGPVDDEPSWGPTGRIVYRHQVVDQVSYDIDVVDPATGAVTNVSGEYPRFAGIFDADPAWSPDGTQIAFVANGANYLLDLFAVDVDGSGYRQLSTDALRHGFPSWAPAPAITAPLGGSSVSGSVDAAADPAPLDTGDVDFTFLDARGGSHFLGTASAPDFTLPFDTTTMPNGPGTLRAYATVSGQTYSVAEPLTVANGASTTLRVAVPGTISVDPAGAGLDPNPFVSYQLQRATCASLLTYPDAAAPRGQQLVPELAQALPAVSSDGLTYTFALRSDYGWSPGAEGPVTGADVRYAIERAVKLDSYAAGILDVLAGERDYVAGTASSISGISVDGSTISFTLTAPHGDFPSRLALPLFCPVPSGASPGAFSATPLPSAGPYYVSGFTPGSSIVLKPNPNYGGDRPRRWQEIDFQLGLSQSGARDLVLAGTADYDPGPFPADSTAALRAKYGAAGPSQRFFVTPNEGVRFVALNASRPFFGDLRRRRAVAYALDRPALADAFAPGLGLTTDQLLPSPLQGFRDLDLFPTAGPDVSAALSALGAAGGGTVTLATISAPAQQQAAQIVTADLAAIGITVLQHAYPSFAALLAALSDPAGGLDLAIVGWLNDYPDPANTFDPLFHSGATTLFPYSAYDAQLDAADAIPLGPARDDAYAAIDQSLSADAPAVAFQQLSNADLFSARVACQVPQPFFGIDLVALCDRANLPLPDSVTASLTSDHTSLTSASSVAISNLPVGLLTSATGANGTTAAPIDQFPIDQFPIDQFPIDQFPIDQFPIDQFPIDQFPIDQFPIDQFPIDQFPIDQFPIDQFPIDQFGFDDPTVATQLGSISLSSLPTTYPGGWQAVLAGTALASQPLQSVTFGQVLQIGLPHDMTFGQIDFRLSPLGRLPAALLALGDAPLTSLPLAGGSSLDRWCTAFAGLGYTCTAADHSQGTVLGAALEGAPIDQFPIDQFDFGGSAIGGVKVSALTNRDRIVLCTAIDCSAAAGKTLADAAAAHAFAPGATLDLLAPDIAGFAVGDLIAGLPGTTPFGDVVALLVPRSVFPWENLDPNTLAAFAGDETTLHMAAAFTLDGVGSGSARVAVHLPSGAYVPGSARLGAAGFPAAPLPDPVRSDMGTTLTWTVPGVAFGTPYAIDFAVAVGADLGPSAATVDVADPAGGPSGSGDATVTVDENLEPNEDAATAPVVAPGTVVVSHVAHAGDVDRFRVAVPPTAGSRLTVHLTNLPADFDLAVFETPPPAGAGFPPPDGVIADQQLPLGTTADSAPPQPVQDIPTIPGLQLVQVSAQRGTDSEDVGIVTEGGGGYVTIQVSGYNGAFSTSPYTLRVDEQGPPAAPSCPARTWPHLADAVRGTLAPGIPADANVAFLVDRWRLTATYGATDAGNVTAALTQLAGRTDLGVHGVVVPVDGYSSVWSAQQAWDADPCSPAAANATAQAIATAAQALRSSAPGLEYLVIVGGDDQIPFFRVPDTTLVANEQSYASVLGANEYGTALSTQNILSDDPYGTLDPVPLGGRPLYVPELAVGRLVETAQQIRQQLLDFSGGATPGVLERSTAFVSGYDFMSDGSQRIADDLTAGGVSVSTLINDTYDKNGLLNGIFPPGGSPADIVVPNGHYDHFRAQPAAGGALVTTADVGPLPGRVVFTMGCHAGLAVSDVILGATGTETDWAQSLTGGGALYAANSGYGLGESTSIAYSEELTADFAAHLDGSGTIGDALVQAKRDYYLARGAFSSYDEKAMNELVFYGLPFWSLGTRRVPLAATAAHAAAASPTTSATAPAASPIVVDPATGLRGAAWAAAPDFQRVHTDRGDYYANDGQVVAVPQQPIVARVGLDATKAGERAHGVLVEALASTDEPDFDPVFARQVDDANASSPEVSARDAAFPSKQASVTTTRTLGGVSQQLVLMTSQFFTDPTSPDAGDGVMRRYTSLSGRVFYSASADDAPPTIARVAAAVLGPLAGFSVDAAGDPVLVYVLYRDQTNAWKGVFLTHGAGDTWTGGVAGVTGTKIEFTVQACDAAGNCGVSSNKARFYFGAPPVSTGGTGPGAVTIDLSGTTSQAAPQWYTGPVTAAVSGGGGTQLSTRVDGGEQAAYTGPVTVSDDGVHSFEGDAANGQTATTAFAIDQTPPAVTISVPRDGAVFTAGSPVPAGFGCTDAGSGVGTCVGTVAAGANLDTSAGTHTFVVHATDNVGHETTVSHSYTVYPFAGFFSPVANPPAQNSARAGAAVPVKFSLGGNRGTGVFATGYPRSVAVSCATGAPIGTPQPTAANGGGLQYDASSQQYTYVWKTDKAWAGSCRELQLLFFDDSTPRVAGFRFR